MGNQQKPSHPTNHTPAAPGRETDAHGNTKDEQWSKVLHAHYWEEELKARSVTDVFGFGAAGSVYGSVEASSSKSGEVGNFCYYVSRLLMYRRYIVVRDSY